MSNELEEKFSKHLETVKKALVDAENQKAEIEATEAEEAKEAKKKEKKLAKINATIEELKAMKERVTLALIYSENVKHAVSLQDEEVSEEEKKELRNKLTNDLNTELEYLDQALTRKANLSDEEVKNIGATASKLIRRLTNLREKIKTANKEEAKEIEENIHQIESTLELIATYQSMVQDIDETKKKIAYLSRLKDPNKIAAVEDEFVETIRNKGAAMNDKVKKDLKRGKHFAKKGAVKEENEKKSNWFKNNWGKITCGVVGVAIVSTLTGFIIHYKKENDRLIRDELNKIPNSSDDLNPGSTTPSKPNENPSEPVPSEPTTTEPATPNEEEIRDAKKQEELTKSLTKKGYNEYNAHLMAKNFSDEAINGLLEYLRPEAEKYAECRNFNLSYLNYYENTTSRYATMPEDTVDYVNRSANILATGFFKEADIDDVTEILYCMDNKMLFTNGNVSVTSPIVNELNDILANYVYGTPVDGEASRLDAFKYFAKEDSDLDRFFTQAATLYQNIVNNPAKQEYKNALMDFLDVYAHAICGVITTPESLTSNDKLNESAILNDHYDYYIAYKAMVAPLGMLMRPTYTVATYPQIPEGASQEEIDFLMQQYELALAEQTLNEENFERNNQRATDLINLIYDAINTNPYCNENSLTR